MSVKEEIGNKLKGMHNRELHEEFYRLTDCLIETGNDDLLDDVLNIIKKYDSVCRHRLGLEQRLNNEAYRRERQRNGYAGMKGYGKKI